MAEPILVRNFTPGTLTKTGGLSQMFAQARKANVINQSLLKLLPSPFDQTLCLLKIDNQIAVFGCVSSAIAFRAKQQKNNILQGIRQHDGFQGVQQIKIKVLLR